MRLLLSTIHTAGIFNASGHFHIAKPHHTGNDSQLYVFKDNLPALDSCFRLKKV